MAKSKGSKSGGGKIFKETRPSGKPFGQVTTPKTVGGKKAC